MKAEGEAATGISGGSETMSRLRPLPSPLIFTTLVLLGVAIYRAIFSRWWESTLWTLFAGTVASTVVYVGSHWFLAKAGRAQRGKTARVVSGATLASLFSLLGLGADGFWALLAAASVSVLILGILEHPRGVS